MRALWPRFLLLTVWFHWAAARVACAGWGGLTADTSVAQASAVALRLRGGKELLELGSRPKGSWLTAPGLDPDGDNVTLFLHSQSRVVIEMSHEYSDGGLIFRAGPQATIKVL